MFACVDRLHTWLRGGNLNARLQCVRELTLTPYVMDVAPEGEELSASNMVTQCHQQVVEFFLAFASGYVKDGEINPRTEKPLVSRQPPYGTKADTSSHYFRTVSPSWFAITAAALYPFLVAEKEEWEELRERTHAYPVTSFWPVTLIRRYNHFHNTYKEHLQSIFRSYESTGGTYFDEDEAGTDSEVSDSQIIEEGNPCDNVF